jgi:PadR family transcriptional regulator, regulatory protein PadR
MRGESIKGHLDVLLLAVLAHGAAHGYAVIEALKSRSGGALDLPEGTVYPALHRLERQGYVTSSWDKSSGRKRRVYALTRRGRSALDAGKEEWVGFQKAMGAVIGT